MWGGNYCHLRQGAKRKMDEQRLIAQRKQGHREVVMEDRLTLRILRFAQESGAGAASSAPAC